MEPFWNFLIGVKTMIYGYIRPLYNDETMTIQRESLTACDVIYEEKHGNPKKRVELENLLMAIQKGDTIIVHRLFSLADSTRHLADLLALCKRDQVTLHFVKECITSDELIEKKLEDVLDFFLNFQSDIIKQSTISGMAEAKAQGKPIGRPKKSDKNVKEALEMYHSGDYTLLDIKNKTGISKSTLYRYLESLENQS